MDRRYRNRSRSRSADKTRRSRSPIVNRSGHRTEGKPDGNWNDRRSEDSRRRGNFNRFRGDGRFDRFRRPNFNRGRFENRPERYERHNNGEKSAPLLDFTMWRSPNEGQQAVCDRDEFKNEFVDSSMLANIENFTVSERKSSTDTKRGGNRSISLSERWSMQSGSNNDPTRKSTSDPDSNRQYDRQPRFNNFRGRNNFRRVPSFQPLPRREIGFRPVENSYRPASTNTSAAATTGAPDDKNVIHLVDPTQVPKGRSYFEHDSRSDPVRDDRNFRGSYRRGGFQPRGPPRDFDRGRNSTAESRNNEIRSPRKFNPEPTGRDPWKHDLFEALEKGET